MQSRDFVYWLQGLFELAEPLTLNKKQTELIRKHLAMVFIHEIDPSMGDEAHQGKLNTVHNSVEMPVITNMHSSSIPPTLPERPNFLQSPLTANELKARC
jgi:hypothetical protein